MITHLARSGKGMVLRTYGAMCRTRTQLWALSILVAAIAAATAAAADLTTASLARLSAQQQQLLLHARGGSGPAGGGNFDENCPHIGGVPLRSTPAERVRACSFPT